VTRSRSRGIFLATVASVVWGTVPVAGQIALGGITAPLLSSIRLLVAGAFLACVLVRRGARPFRRPPPLVYLAALGLAANYVCYMWGLERAGPAAGQVVITTAPLFLIAFGVVWLGERLTARRVLGGLAALAGVALVSWEPLPDAPQRNAGIVIMIVAAITWAVYGAAHRRLGDRHASGTTMMWIFLLSAMLIAPCIAAEPWRGADGVQLAAIVYLCINSIVAYWCFAEAVRHIDASLAAVITTLGPVIAFGCLLVTNRIEQSYVPFEPLSAWKLGGAALVMGGVATAITARR